jgi:hypothetical protein
MLTQQRDSFNKAGFSACDSVKDKGTLGFRSSLNALRVLFTPTHQVKDVF